ncbi:MAG: NusG domain II-containing protein [Velocimicrobium sp.]
MKWIKKRDIYVILGVLLFAAILSAGYHIYVAHLPAKAEIYYASKLVKTVVLDTGKDETFTIPESNHVTFHLYADGSIAFEESDCPDQICVKAGKLHLVGQSAACLPNKIIIKIVPSKENAENDVDIIR